jgi:hypothetical protein
MDRIIIKDNLLSQEASLIPVIRWLFPECQIHVVPGENTARRKAKTDSLNPSAGMEANQGA